MFAFAKWKVPAGCALVFVAATAAYGQAVHVVAGDGSGNFTQLQQAVNAAANGDVILVKPHATRYDPTVINGKGLTIVGDGAARAGVFDVTVTNLPPGSSLTLRHLDIEGSSEVDIIFGVITVHDGLTLSNNAGCVWIEDSALAGRNGINDAGAAGIGKIGLVASSSDCVVVVGCELTGGSGGVTVGGTALVGGAAARAVGSRVAMWGTTAVGGTGAPGVGTGIGGRGGTGFESVSSEVFLSGCSLSGGDTGTGSSTTPTAPGLDLADASSLRYVETVFAAGGGPGPAGPPVTTSGAPSTIVDQNDDHRQINIPAAMRELTPAQVTYAGEAGDVVLLAVSPAPGWAPISSLKGVLHLGVVTTSMVLGTADATGSLVLNFNLPALPPGVLAVVGSAQPLVAEANGHLRLAAPSSILLLDASL